MDKDAEFQKRLLATFKVEAGEHLKGMSSGLVELEKAESSEKRGAIVETVFREAHSLKGAARAVGLSDIETLCQAMEGVFVAMKRNELAPYPELFDLMQQAVDFLGRLLADLAAERSSEDKDTLRDFVTRFGKAGIRDRGPGTGEEKAGTRDQGTGPGEEKIVLPETRGEEQGAKKEEGVREEEEAPIKPVPGSRSPVPGISTPVPALSETVRVSTAKLSSVLLQSEEMLSAKLWAGQHAAQTRETRNAFTLWKKEWGKVLPQLQKLKGAGEKSTLARQGESRRRNDKELAKILEFLHWNGEFIKSLEGRHAADVKSAERYSRALGGMVDNLLEDVKKVMMFPFSSLLEIFPKIVRDLARDHGKEADLIIRGEEIEIDRRILEELKDPLIHLVRNCLDHGIEKPDERELKNKPRRGRVTIEIAPKDGKAEITVSDDGVGIDIDKVRAALRKSGAIIGEKAEGLPEDELLQFIFHSGVSTSPIITEISGRGLGLAIVKEKAEKLGGTVSLENRPGAGTTFRMLLPLTLATFRGILVRVTELLFVLPTAHVERVVRMKRDEIKTVENRETIHLNGKALSMARLADALELSSPVPAASPDQVQVAVLSAGEKVIAFVVDEVLHEQEVLLKTLGPQLSRVRNISGATVLGSGSVVPILNVPDLMKSATKGVTAHQAAPPVAGAPEAPPMRGVLVVEDSITSRTLLKNILESAGYDVKTAVDGVDAFTQLKSGDFDIVISDVDMPRMNGFDLTARIRGDKRLGEIPVVLVTALESREDKERGIDVGANAYIVKSSFDQSNLLEVMKRLV